ncbi:sensor histidine kinase [alpha proteobacterium U9-1i]|nr:sensor histidine kinase [alpha proteobacterium U9-1i]
MISLNPLRTLTGRMVLVTVVAVLLAYAVAFALYANERGAAIRRATETGLVERLVFTVERVRETPPENRAAVAGGIREYGLRFQIDASPAIQTHNPSGVAGRVARALSLELGGAEVRANARIVEEPVLRRRDRDEAGPGGPPRERHGINERRRANDGRVRFRNTEVRLSIALDDGDWLNARARLLGPRPLPLNVIFAALVSVIGVGIGAALISRQIGQPLAKLADAARALGSGQTNVSAPVSGPEDVRRASTAFNAMAERLGRQLNRQRQMLWALSHDLRTPITALKLRMELLEDDAARERLRGPIEEMERLTEQALSLARAGASEEARTSVDLAEIVRTLCGELQDMGLDVRADAPTAVVAECRPFEIARALRNLAENAVKYAGSGSMRAGRTEAGEAFISVLDQGPGVAPDQLARLSEPFFRADSARGETTAGAGLGLAIVQAIADSHGGRLVLENRTPKGFSATLVLPA